MSVDRPSDRVLKDLTEALLNGAQQSSSFDEHQVVSDPGRLARKGIPEVVFAQNKSLEQVQHAVFQLIDTTGRVIVSRLTGRGYSRAPLGVHRFGGRTSTWELDGRGVACRISGRPEPAEGLRYSAAGSSDWPAANEARTIGRRNGL